jgi:prefoldin subunit 5
MAAPSRLAARQAKAAETLNEQTEELARRVAELQQTLNEVNGKLDMLLDAASAPNKKGASK